MDAKPLGSGVVDDQTGQRLKDRRVRMGMSVRQLAEEADVDRGRLAKLEAGEGHSRDTTIGKVESTLTRLEHEMGMDEDGPASGNGNVRYTISGNFGVGVVVEGPVEVAAELEASAMRIVAQMQTPTPALAPELDREAEIDPAVYAEMRKVGRLSKSRPRNPVTGQDH